MAGPKLELLGTNTADRASARREMSRREFVRVATIAGASLATGGLAAACEGPSAAPDASSAPDGGPAPDAAELVFDLPTLGGAPDTDQGRTIAAFCDTIVPGAHRDPTAAVGAIDTGAPGFFFDPSLPALQYVGVLALALDSASTSVHRVRRFWALTPDQRDAAVEHALLTVPLLAFAVQLAKLAYFASPEAGAHLGYPGPNAGYRDDANFTYGRAMATEITTDGNLP